MPSRFRFRFRFRWRRRDRGAARAASAMSRALSPIMGVGVGVALAALLAPAAAAEPCADAASHAAFLAENDRAMERMMNAMAIEASGDVDRDFVRMMVPHHRGAIEMAMAQLRHGCNPQLRRIAQEIIATQQQEIAAMHLAIGLPPDAAPAPPSNSPVHREGAAAAPAAAHHSHKEPR